MIPWSDPEFAGSKVLNSGFFGHYDYIMNRYVLMKYRKYIISDDEQ